MDRIKSISFFMGGIKMGRMFGYARVSSREQNLDRQIQTLKKYVDEEHILVNAP